MKLNRIFLLSIFLLAIVSLGAVSASEDVNATASEEIAQDANLAIENSNSIADDHSEEVLGDTKSAGGCNVTFPDVIKPDQSNYLEVTLPEGATGGVSIYLDDRYQSGNTVYEGSNIVSFIMNTPGTHVLDVRFNSWNTSLCLNGNCQKEYNITNGSDVILSVQPRYQYGYPNSLDLIVPLDSKAEFEVFIDGNKWEDVISLEDLGYSNEYLITFKQFVGTHDVLVVYKGDDKYRPHNITAKFYVEAFIRCEDIFIYGKDDYTPVVLLLPEDAKGNLIVSVDGASYANVSLINGSAAPSFVNLSIGTHEISAYYDGSDYNVTPLDKNVTVSGVIQVYKNGKFIKNRYINVELFYGDELSFCLTLPKDANGKLNITLYRTSYVADVVNGTAKVVIPFLPLDDYDFVAKYDSNDTYEVGEIKGMFCTSPTLLPIPDLVVFGKNIISINASEGFYGTAKVIVDGDEDNPYIVTFTGIANIPLSGITGGNHTLAITVYKMYYSYFYSFGYIDVTVANATAPKIIVANTALYYMDGSFVATVYGVDGKPLKNAIVLFKVNGKNAQYVRTDAKGRAIFKMTNLP